jgi:hypothetical protein
MFVLLVFIQLSAIAAGQKENYDCKFSSFLCLVSSFVCQCYVISLVGI